MAVEPVEVQHSVDSGRSWRVLGRAVPLASGNWSLERGRGWPDVATLRTALAADAQWAVRIGNRSAFASAPLCHVWHDPRRATLTLHAAADG